MGQSCSSHGHTEAENKDRARDTVYLSRSCTQWPTCCSQALPSAFPPPPSYISILIHPWINLLSRPEPPDLSAYQKPAGNQAHEHASVTFFQFGSTSKSFYCLPKMLSSYQTVGRLIYRLDQRSLGSTSWGASLQYINLLGGTSQPNPNKFQGISSYCQSDRVNRNLFISYYIYVTICTGKIDLYSSDKYILDSDVADFLQGFEDVFVNDTRSSGLMCLLFSWQERGRYHSYLHIQFYMTHKEWQKL